MRRFLWAKRHRRNDLSAKKALALTVIDRLKNEYPDAGCTLDYDHAWQLLVSVRLAAQCTDARVNIVVQELFAKYSDVAALAAAEPEEHRSHRQALRPWAQQGAGYLSLYAGAAGQVQLQGAHHL